MMGWWRYLLVYLLSIVGGSFGVLLLDDPTAEVVGASGGIFGLIGAYLVIMVVLRERDNIRALMIMIAVKRCLWLPRSRDFLAGSRGRFCDRCSCHGSAFSASDYSANTKLSEGNTRKTCG